MGDCVPKLQNRQLLTSCNQGVKQPSYCSDEPYLNTRYVAGRASD